MFWIKNFSGLLLVRKQELCDLNKTIFLEFEMINKNDAIVVAMATMTFQYGRHFGFKHILLEYFTPVTPIFYSVFYKYNGKFKRVLKNSVEPFFKKFNH